MMLWKKWLSYIWPGKIGNGYSISTGKPVSELSKNMQKMLDEFESEENAPEDININDFKNTEFHVRSDNTPASVKKVVYKNGRPYGYQVELLDEHETIIFTFKTFQLLFRSNSRYPK